MIPEKFGRYEVLGELGDGAMGRVYRAFDPIVRRAVAVKTIKSEYLTREEAPDYLRRFRREAQAAGVLNHPSIVSIFDVGENYLVMELLEGKTLQALLLEKGKLDPAEALRILTPVAEGLDHAHRAGILHRDIKPANIMVLPDGRAKLMDFGVAHVETSTSVMTTAGQIFGSPSYMSPEQVSGADVDSRSDLYSLAVVAYEVLTGQRPFQGTSLTSIIYKVMSEVPAPPRQWNRTLPARYDEVFERALAKDANRRYATGIEFLAALDFKELDLALSSALEPGPAPEDSAQPKAPPSTQTAATVAGEAIPARLAPEALAAPVAAPAAANANRLWLGIAGVAAVGILAFVFLRHPSGTPADGLRVAAPSPLPTDLATPGAVAVATPLPAPVATPTPSATASPRAPRPRPTATPTPLPEPTPVPTATPPPPLVEGTLVELSPDVTPPKRISGQSVSYPETARRLKIYGAVAVSLVVDAQGQPTEMKVVESGGQVLDEAVLKAVAGWRFQPAVKDGVKVSVRWLVRQRFQKGP
jgi:eukaryotic-like serine/threonine-protein kinase